MDFLFVVDIEIIKDNKLDYGKTFFCKTFEEGYFFSTQLNVNHEVVNEYKHFSSFKVMKNINEIDRSRKSLIYSTCNSYFNYDDSESLTISNENSPFYNYSRRDLECYIRPITNEDLKILNVKDFTINTNNKIYDIEHNFFSKINPFGCQSIYTKMIFLEKIDFVYELNSKIYNSSIYLNICIKFFRTPYWLLEDGTHDFSVEYYRTNNRYSINPKYELPKEFFGLEKFPEKIVKKMLKYVPWHSRMLFNNLLKGNYVFNFFKIDRMKLIESLALRKEFFQDKIEVINMNTITQNKLENCFISFYSSFDFLYNLKN